MNKLFTVAFFIFSFLFFSWAFAEDITTGVDDLDQVIWDQKARDLGDDTYALSVVNEGPPSVDVSCSYVSNSSLSSLVSSINSALSGSADRLHSIGSFSDGTLTPTFYAVICEISN